MSQIFIHFFLYYFHIVPFSSIPNLFWYMIYIKFKLIPFPKVFPDIAHWRTVCPMNLWKFHHMWDSYTDYLLFLNCLFCSICASIFTTVFHYFNDFTYFKWLLIFIDLILVKYSSFKTFYCSCSIIPDNSLRIIFQIIVFNPLGFWLAVWVSFVRLTPLLARFNQELFFNMVK